MTEEKKSSIQHLDKEDIEEIHKNLSEEEEKEGEPISPFRFDNSPDIDALVSAPKQSFYGQEAYSTIEEKAAIIFYTINKRQIFLNGNKRMSTACLLVFLGLNNRK